MKPINEKLRRAIVELHLDQNFQLILTWIIASYMDELVHTSLTSNETRDYSAGKAAALGALLDELAKMAKNEPEYSKSMTAALKQKLAYT